MINSEIQLTLLTGELKPEILSYIAGLFDGEGYIRTQVKPARLAKGYGLVLQMGIVNTDKEVLEADKVFALNTKRGTEKYESGSLL